MASGCIQSIKWSMKYIGHDEISNRKARDIKAQKNGSRFPTYIILFRSLFVFYKLLKSITSEILMINLCSVASLASSILN